MRSTTWYRIKTETDKVFLLAGEKTVNNRNWRSHQHTILGDFKVGFGIVLKTALDLQPETFAKNANSDISWP
jgi:hypothetical protein